MVSKWIRTLFTTGTVEINKELIDEIKISKKNNIKRIKELYIDVNKLKTRLGFKGYTTLND